MRKSVERLGEIRLVGISVRTSNWCEMNSDTAKIGRTMQKFLSSGMQTRIRGRRSPGTVFGVYTGYESDENGEYRYFVGEEVDVIDALPEYFEVLTIPAQAYVKLTSEQGSIPAVCIDMWQNIWRMKATDLGGERAYIADFEIYDERSKDSKSAIIDIYIGIQT
ncbi:AraC family transcriptional regulator [Rickettsiales endosymbiont of Peranema trichophorum]|uniref:GyrI-like domain-containing protein n=1 Tax=Rickettsiales endosymbiont of Peranema trichophorum TaxID=2486577 RepID=UPI001023D044|nr:GyrI-like domain-containing protein [Rickettsiales endosymbiont of Peranema trichophorum]RZI45542.1 AraC family transcriptional regulator [Rickettsiales endosymbiont of Peranema trichophorum]